MYIKKSLYALFITLCFYSCSQSNTHKNKEDVNNKNITNYITQKYKKGFRAEKDGWVYLHLEGNSYERGFQYGQLIAKDFYEKTLNVFKDIFYLTTGLKYEYIQWACLERS